MVLNHCRRFSLGLVAVLLGWICASERLQAAQPGEGIGVVVAARQVTGTLVTERRELAKDDPVFQDDVLETGGKGSGEFRLGDETKLALGPGARLTLDEFVYDADKGTPTLVVDLLEGSFRFVTGKLEHKAYKIRAGAATLGVRGTIFDVYADAKNGVAVLLHEGAVEICNAAASCRSHVTIGRVIHVSASGVVSAPLEWSDTIIPGIGLERAFPFLSRRLAIDPVRRLGAVAIVARPVIRTGRKLVGKVGRSAGKLGRRARRLIRSPF